MEKHSFTSSTPTSFPEFSPGKIRRESWERGFWLFASVAERNREVKLTATEKHRQSSGQSVSLTTKASKLASPALAMTTRPQ